MSSHTYYDSGTITLVNGSNQVTGVGTGWNVALVKSGTVFVEADGGNPLPIASVDSNVKITASLKWMGPSGTYSYSIARQDDVNQVLEQAGALTMLLHGLRNGTIFKYDETGPLADLTLWANQRKGFSYLVTEGTEADLYVKRSDVPNDWAGPFSYGAGPVGPAPTLSAGTIVTLQPGQPATFTVAGSGGFYSINLGIPAGPIGVNYRGLYSSAEQYTIRDAVTQNGSTWYAKQVTTGNAPPGLPTTENAYWTLIAAKGVDGNGAGDMLAPVYDPTNVQADVFDRENHTGTQDIRTLRNAVQSLGIQPKGRLSFSPQAVATSDIAVATQIHYVPDTGNVVPVWDGVSFEPIVFSPLTLPLSAYHEAAKNYDLYVFMVGQTPAIGSSPAWVSNNLRGTALNIINHQGIIINEYEMQVRVGSGASDVTTIDAGKGTLLGTVRIGAVAGQSHWQIKPAAAAGGTNNKLFLSNVYNRRIIYPSCRFTGFWTIPAGTALRTAGGSGECAIQFVQSLPDTVSTGEYTTVMEITSAGAVPRIAVGLDGVVAASELPLIAGPVGLNSQLRSAWSGFAGAGFHFIASLESNAGSGIAAVGGTSSALKASLEM